VGLWSPYSCSWAHQLEALLGNKGTCNNGMLYFSTTEVVFLKLVAVWVACVVADYWKSSTGALFPCAGQFFEMWWWWQAQAVLVFSF
jgi:hypothetical protein